MQWIWKCTHWSTRRRAGWGGTSTGMPRTSSNWILSTPTLGTFMPSLLSIITRFLVFLLSSFSFPFSFSSFSFSSFSGGSNGLLEWQDCAQQIQWKLLQVDATFVPRNSVWQESVSYLFTAHSLINRVLMICSGGQNQKKVFRKLCQKTRFWS